MRLVCTLVLFVLAGAVARAEPPIKITARVGLPDARNPDARIAKFGAWVPVEVDLGYDSSLWVQLQVETPDADGVMTVLRTPMGGKGRSFSYIRPAAGSGDTTLTILGNSGTPNSEPYRVRDLRPRDSLTYVVLALGSRFPSWYTLRR